jgi:hypothetical protein
LRLDSIAVVVIVLGSTFDSDSSDSSDIKRRTIIGWLGAHRQ